MKKASVFIFVLGAVLLAVVFKRANEKSVPFVRTARPVPVMPLVQAEVLGEPALAPGDSLGEAELRRLTFELAEVDDELGRLGYPKVMLDERLSEVERSQIVAKVLRASELHNQIVRLRLEAIDRQARLGQ